MKIKEECDASTGDFWCDLTDGGYLKPEKICENPEDAKRVIEAIKIVKEFETSCQEQIEGFKKLPCSECKSAHLVSMWIDRDYKLCPHCGRQLQG